jgi:arylsulfatase A-like enzyme
MPDRPNVLLVVADQHTAGAVGFEDDTYRTPHVDALAREGTRFSRCYCTHPQCSPSRSSLVTGLYPHQTGVQALPNWPSSDVYALDPESHSVGRTFQDAGYDTGWFGRWDLGEGNAGPLGFETTLLDVTGSPGRTGRDRDDETVDATTAFVREAEAPFFGVVSFNLPHRPYYDEPRFADEFDPADVPLPLNFHDDLADKPALQREWAPGDAPEEYREGGPLTPEQFRDVGARYRSMVRRVDHYLGRIRAALSAEGIAEDTVVVFTADHGDMMGGHGLVGKHTVAYEEELRVPLVVSQPDDDWPAVVDDVVSQVALPGTLLELAGLDVPPAFEGGSLSAAVRGEGPNRAYFEHKVATGELHPLRGVRTERWKYVDYFADDAAELYDLDNDPHEMENLADEEAYADVEADLRADVLDWWDRTGGDEDSWSEPVPD